MGLRVADKEVVTSKSKNSRLSRLTGVKCTEVLNNYNELSLLLEQYVKLLP